MDTNNEVANTQDVESKVEAGKETKYQKLTPKQERFIIEYIKCNEGKKACILSGYKESNAYNTASNLLKNPIVVKEIQRQKALLHKGLLKDRSVFLTEVEELKAMCKEKGRVGELIKLLTLEASVLGIDKRDVAVNTTNIFNAVDSAKSFLNGFKAPIDVEGGEVRQDDRTAILDPLERKQSTQESANDTTQTCATHAGDVISTLSGEVIKLNSDLWGGE